MLKVTILQHRLLHYRTELFEKIRSNLSNEGVQLNLIHGGASKLESKRNDEATLPWANKITNHFFRIKGVDLIWQSLPSDINDCDLLILMQENRILSNYPKIIIRNLLRKKTGYWGHGKNLQSNKPNGFKEMWKKKWLNSVEYWFAYTPSTVDYLINQSFPENAITCLNNAIDVNNFKADLAQVSEETIKTTMQALNIPQGSDVGVFCGSLYKEKRLELLLDAIDIIKKIIPKFYVVIIGDGPSATFLHDAVVTRDWLKLVGVKKGSEKAVYYKFSSIMLNPGLVGLHILDSFCAGLPMVTTEDALHSPEYDYLINGVNGLVTVGTATSYAAAVVKLLSDQQKLNEMKIEALADSEKYTVEQMANNFSQGIIKALAQETNQ
jgi:glycosyltransferase involved in cell wall biosynthesis